MHRRPDSNIYQFGLRVPIDLRDRFPTPWAIRCSLQTADIRAANAKAKGLQVEWEGRFQALRTGQEQPKQIDPAPSLHDLRLALLKRIEAALPGMDSRASGLSAEERREKIGSAQWVLDSGRDALEGGWIDDVGAEDWIAQLAPTKHPAAAAEIQAARVLLSELYVEALSDTSRTFPLRVQRLRERRALLASAAAVQQPTPGTVVTGPVSVTPGHRIMDAFDVWNTEGRPAKTVSKFKSHARQFLVLAGDPVLEGFTKRDAIEFRNAVQSWAVEEGKTATTANNVLISVRAIFTAARDQGWIENNPLSGLEVKTGGKKGERREPWTHDELRLLFGEQLPRETELFWTQVSMETLLGQGIRPRASAQAHDWMIAQTAATCVLKSLGK
ncbi:hypothetical protein AO062_14655 [Variovorax boronicumulans]|nr:hypothetical protein AO062_14655 [Variovorax boronicumulans]